MTVCPSVCPASAKAHRNRAARSADLQGGNRDPVVGHGTVPRPQPRGNELQEQPQQSGAGDDAPMAARRLPKAVADREEELGREGAQLDERRKRGEKKPQRSVRQTGNAPEGYLVDAD